MSESPIRRVVVLGAGTMGAAIAAHCANAGLRVDLLDIASPDPASEDRDAVVQAGFERMLKARPAALASPRLAAAIRLGNFDDNLDRLGEADWILEAIVEQLEPKQDLAARVEKAAAAGAIISSNTSGIPLRTIAEGRGAEFRRRFLGTHFFNPPRYLKLVELIPTADTDPAVLARMRAFMEEVLGKGPVIAKDTPNFIGNRLGSFGKRDMRIALERGYSIEEVDALAGPVMGRPKTAIFRLADQVGLDVMVGVAENLYELVPDDESREEFRSHELLRRMLAAGRLGNKTGGGFYKRTQRDGQSVFDVLDLETFEYRPAKKPRLPVISAAREYDDLGERLRFILDRADQGADRDAALIRDLLLPALAYAARRVPEISDTLEAVDHAMEWGYGHEAGPFRTWDLLGVREAVRRMDDQGIEVAGWVRDFLAAGNQRFYQDGSVYSPVTGRYQPVETDPRAIDLEAVKADGGRVAGNDSASLVDLGDGVLCLELHSPASAVDAGVIETAARALEELSDDRWAGLVLANQARNFCVGANLMEVGMAAAGGAYDQVGEAAATLQRLLAGFRDASKPVVAAPHGQTLGAGAEICMHSDRVVPTLETYIGLVEVGAGLIPAGGGCKELLRRVVSPAMRADGATPLPYLQRVLETIGAAKVATSALEARELGFFTDADPIVMNPDHQLAAAKRQVLALAANYRPPVDRSVYAAGRDARAALELGVRTLEWGRFASEHDALIGTTLARVLCGGDLSQPQWVDEDHVLKLEREAFVALLHQQKTLERMQALLTSGKPLRN